MQLEQETVKESSLGNRNTELPFTREKERNATIEPEREVEEQRQAKCVGRLTGLRVALIKAGSSCPMTSLRYW